ESPFWLCLAGRRRCGGSGRRRRRHPWLRFARLHFYDLRVPTVGAHAKLPALILTLAGAFAGETVVLVSFGRPTRFARTRVRTSTTISISSSLTPASAALTHS